MSNGAQCCALEICCPPGLMLIKLPPMIAAFTNVDEAECKAFVERVKENDLVFAPKSFSGVAQHYGAVHSILHREEFIAWMVHEELTFAPAVFSDVLQDIVDIVKKNGVAA